MFDWSILTTEDSKRAKGILSGFRDPDFVIAPEDTPYLYRWYVTPKSDAGNVYFHIQVDSDPQRPLHDHPWDNTSLILSGGYRELYADVPLHMAHSIRTRYLLKGQMVFRAAREAHRLELPRHIPYTMTLFTTGPKIRTWGFWPDGKFVPYTKFVEMSADGSMSVTQEKYRHG